MTNTTLGSVVAASSLHSCGDFSIRFLALERSRDGDETYHVSFSPAPGAAFRPGVMQFTQGESWELSEDGSSNCTSLLFGSPDEVFRLAIGDSSIAQRARAERMTKAAPHWPTSLTESIIRRRLSGAGVIAFDARWFLSQLATSAFDQPLLFPNATSKLGLDGLKRASDLVRDCATGAAAHDHALANLLMRALSAETTAESALGWNGDGRLIGEYASGELAQLGTDIGDGCQAALGSGPHHVLFDSAEPLGLSLGPVVPSDATGDVDHESIGMGVEVGEVEADGAADRAGVIPGMVLSHLTEPDLALWSNGRCNLSFETALKDIDMRRATGRALAITFATAAPVSHLYAVEMPAAATLTALATAQGLSPAITHSHVDTHAALADLCGGALLWCEDTPRLFFGEAGSLTCAHTDICPQLELAHGLFGWKLLGVASHNATTRLSAEHAGDEEGHSDEEATRVPTDRPLTRPQSSLLSDPDVSVALLQHGDLAVFDSGALHFASNAADGLSAALYQGVMTPAAVARLKLAATQPEGVHSNTDGAYQNHLYAADLLRIVEPLLAEFERENELPASENDAV